MAADLRVNVGLPRTPKLRKLIRQLGPGAAWSLICLWAYAAEHRTDGDLAGMADDDIELAADWTGEPGEFVGALVALRWLDGEAGARQLHDWAVHQPWVAGAAERSEASRWAALCKRYGRAGAAARMPDYAARTPDGADRMRPAPAPHAEREPSQCDPRAPSPIPSPIPKADPASSDIVEGRERLPIDDDVQIAAMRDQTPPDAPLLVTPAPSTYRGEACKSMRRGGIIQTNPTHPDLLAAEADGVSLEVWEPTARECVERGKASFAYVIATARSRHREGAAVVPIGSASAAPRESAAERVARINREAELRSATVIDIGSFPAGEVRHA